METLSINPAKSRNSPSPVRQNPADHQSQQLRKSAVLNESELDSKMKHWEEYRIKGLKISRRSYHSAVTYNQSLYVYGGYDINTGILQDFIKTDLNQSGGSFEWQNVTINSALKPGPRSRHTATVYRDKMYLYGGQINSVENTNRLLTFDFATLQWSEVAVTSQEPVPQLDSHCAILWSKDDERASILFVGGFKGGKHGGYSNAVYEYSINENKWTVLFKNTHIDISKNEPSDVPPGRASLGAALINDQLYIFGGYEGNNKFNDLWAFDLPAKKWTFIKPEGELVPEPRNGHTLVAYKNLLILFGGILDITHEKNDIFVFSTRKKIWISIEKDTKWIFDDKEPIKKSPSTVKQHILSAKGDRSLHSSEEPSPELKDKSDSETKSSPSKSPSKYSKLKLQESLPKGVSPAREQKSSDDEAGATQTGQKQLALSQYESSIREKQKRDKLLRKMILLKEFEVDESNTEDLKTVMPALEAMQNSIKSLGLSEKSPEKGETNIQSTMASFDVIRSHAGKFSDDGNPIKVGVKPVARDGHSATMLGDKMIIFAGDRHKMSFNDVFALNLKYFDNINF